MRLAVSAVLLVATSRSFSAYASPSSRPIHGGQTVNLWRLEKLREEKEQSSPFELFVNQQFLSKPTLSVKEEFPEQWFEQPLDHFSDAPHTFNQRYWVNKRHYKKGGPVIVLDGGETSGEDRIPFLDTGIVEILAKATDGLGVVLEHRYYGASTFTTSLSYKGLSNWMLVTKGDSIAVANLSTDSLRYVACIHRLTYRVFNDHIQVSQQCAICCGFSKLHGFGEIQWNR